jgi:bis(5'-adenosyl)-triphosphatase
LSFALVNLKPILPGHVLVSPRRCVPRVADLTPAEAVDLFLTVRRIGRMVERVFEASSLNIAIQDGLNAGQSVPHVHAHLIPRRGADLDARGGKDAIYSMLDGDEGDLGRIHRETESEEERAKKMTPNNHRRSGFPAVDNDRRVARSEEEMTREAAMLAREMEKEPKD